MLSKELYYALWDSIKHNKTADSGWKAFNQTYIKLMDANIELVTTNITGGKK